VAASCEDGEESSVCKHRDRADQLSDHQVLDVSYLQCLVTMQWFALFIFRQTFMKPDIIQCYCVSTVVKWQHDTRHWTSP
jgi:hypothetical protein